MAVSLKRSDKFPVGTSVGAYEPGCNRHHEGKPSGAAVETRTVDSNGLLTFTTVTGPLIELWAEVAGKNANMLLGNEDFTPPGTLKERLARKRAEVKA